MELPVLDLKGKVNGVYNKGLLEDAEIENVMNTIMERGGQKIYMTHPETNFLLSNKCHVFLVHWVKETKVTAC
jgi:hypothetical protein